MNDIPNTSGEAAPAPAAKPAKEPKTSRVSVASTTWYNAEGKEAESPLDSIRHVTFKLDNLKDHPGWTHDFGPAREAMLTAGLDPKYVALTIAYGGFGYKTKLTNVASGVRNDAKLKGTPEAGDEAQAAEIDDFLSEAEAGNWRAQRGEGESVPGVDDLAQAVFNIQVRRGKTGADLEKIKADIKKMDKDGRAAYRKNPEINVELGEIRLARARAKLGKTAEGAVSTDDLLNIGSGEEQPQA